MEIVLVICLVLWLVGKAFQTPVPTERKSTRRPRATAGGLLVGITNRGLKSLTRAMGAKTYGPGGRYLVRGKGRKKGFWG